MIFIIGFLIATIGSIIYVNYFYKKPIASVIMIPPVHQNCRCVTLPVAKGEVICSGDMVIIDNSGYAKTIIKTL